MTSVLRIFPIPGYPAERLTRDGEKVTVRPMIPDDADALLEFFRGISKEERFYLKDDVPSPRVIGQWISQLDYWRVLPLVVTIDARVIADATLHHGRAGASDGAGAHGQG